MNSTKLSQTINKYYDGLVVIPNTTVSYVNLLHGRKQPQPRINFVCVRKDRAISEPVQPMLSTPISAKTEGDNSELAGSPLKDDFELEIVNMSIEARDDHYRLWSDTEETYGGVNDSLARELIGDIGDLDDDSDRKCGPVWILCNGSDFEDTLLLENEFNGNWWIRGSVSAQKPVAIESVLMDDLVHHHVQRYPGLNNFDTEIESTYYLRHNIHVRVDMTFHRQLPSFTYFQGAQLTLIQFLPKEDNRMNATSFWCDILTLNYIKKFILEYSASGKNDPVYECGSGMRLIEIREEIATLFTTVVFGTDQHGQNHEELMREDLESVVASAKVRDYTDITDNLWNLLKCCASYQDLKAAFNYTFHFVQRNHICNIPANKNHVATLIKEISEGRLTNLVLSGTEPLELLLEIGLEKLEKDYEFIFLRSNTTTAEDLKMSNDFFRENVTMNSGGMIRKSVFHSAKDRQSKAPTARTTLLLKTAKVGADDYGGFHYSDFDENEVEMKLCKLAHYHGILEHLLQMKTCFNNAEVFASIMEHMLKEPMHYPFKVVKERGFKKLDMEIANNSLLKFVKDKFPSVRRVTFQTRKPLIEVKTTFVHSLDSIFPSSANALGDLAKEDKDEKTMMTQQYNQYCYVHAKTRI